MAAIKYNKRVIAFDVENLVDLDLINYTAKRLGYNKTINSINSLDDIGIKYIVTDGIGGINGYTDIVSTAVLEHVPINGLNDIFKFAGQLNIKTITANIDFKDHWSYIEDVRQDEFYYVSDLYWKIINNKRMYQNRLRLSDINKIAGKYGYAVAEIEKSMFLQPVKIEMLNSKFKKYKVDDIQIAQCLIKYKLK